MQFYWCKLKIFFHGLNREPLTKLVFIMAFQGLPLNLILYKSIHDFYWHFFWILVTRKRMILCLFCKERSLFLIFGSSWRWSFLIMILKRLYGLFPWIKLQEFMILYSLLNKTSLVDCSHIIRTFPVPKMTIWDIMLYKKKSNTLMHLMGMHYCGKVQLEQIQSAGPVLYFLRLAKSFAIIILL